LIERTRGRDDVDLIYVNDNYGDFTADFDDIVRSALAGERPDLVEPIVPVPGSLVVSKVRHSVFYASPLEYLLRRLEAQQIVLTGQVTEQCILYSALDRYVRHYDVVVAPDAVAHIDAEVGSSSDEADSAQYARRNPTGRKLPGMTSRPLAFSVSTGSASR
jgi:nicotinamidase-related amidase